MKTIVISNIIVIAVFLFVGCAANNAGSPGEAEPVKTISDQPNLERKMAVNAKKYNRNLPGKPNPETGIRLDRCSSHGLTFKYFLTETWVVKRFKTKQEIAEMKDLQREVVLDNWRTGAKAKRYWMSKGITYHYHYSDLYGNYLYDFKVSSFDFRDVPNVKAKEKVAAKIDPNAFDPKSREELVAMLPQWVAAWNQGTPAKFTNGSIDRYEHGGGTKLITYLTNKNFAVGDPFIDLYGKGEMRSRMEFWEKTLANSLRHDWSDKTIRLMFYECELEWDWVMRDKNGEVAFTITLNAADFPQ